MLIAGIDEAGRGSLLGPLVMAVVCLPESSIPLLNDMGIRESKALTPEERTLRQAQIKQLARKNNGLTAFKAISPDRIDRFRKSHPRGGLNELERLTAQELLQLLFRRWPPDREKLTVILDGRNIFAGLAQIFSQNPLTRLRAEDQADQNHPIVAAASIIAKHHRDLRFEKICQRYLPEFGPIQGKGYPNPGTKKFIRDYRRRHGCYPPEIRKTWKSLERLETKQTSFPFPE